MRYGLWTAADICRQRKLPLQLHVGFGDPDVYMHACDPTHFTDFLRSMEAWQVTVTLLHNYPFLREAAWLSEIFQNVYYDAGVILNFAGPSNHRIMREALEMGPFTKQLFSTDAFGLAELHFRVSCNSSARCERRSMIGSVEAIVRLRMRGDLRIDRPRECEADLSADVNPG